MKKKKLKHLYISWTLQRGLLKPWALCSDTEIKIMFETFIFGHHIQEEEEYKDY